MAAIPFISTVDIIMVSVFFYLLFAFRDHLRRGGSSYPPGPKPWPVIGNLLDIPKESQWIAYTEMSKKHGLGDILSKQCTLFTETRFHIF